MTTIYDNMVYTPGCGWETSEEFDPDGHGAVWKDGKRFGWFRDTGDNSPLLKGIEDTWEMAASKAMTGDTYVDLETEGEGQDMITEVVINALLDAEDEARGTSVSP